VNETDIAWLLDFLRGKGGAHVFRRSAARNGLPEFGWIEKTSRIAHELRFVLARFVPSGSQLELRRIELRLTAEGLEWLEDRKTSEGPA